MFLLIYNKSPQPSEQVKKMNQELLKTLIDYDKETGHMRWIRRLGGKTKVGDNVGNRHHTGYIHTSISGKRYLCHRLAWLYVYGEMPKGQIDHVNGKRDDNRIENLRETNSVGNNQNLRTSRGKTGLLGVTFNSGKYVSNIIANGERFYLGRFESKESAHEAYVTAKRKLHSTCTI